MTEFVRVKRVARQTYAVELLAALRSWRHAEDRDFLPGALELLEAPPSPIKIGLIYTICTCSAVFLAWACLGSIEEYASAPGKVQAAGRTKVVQPLQSGRVTAMSVSDGTRVRPHDVLIELDPTEALAALRAADGDLADARAEVLRRSAAIEAARRRRGRGSRDDSIAWSPDIPPDVRPREQAVLDADLQKLDSILAGLEAQKRQQETERDKAAASIESEKALIEVLSERVAMRTELEQKQAMSRANVLDATQELRQAETTDTSLIGSLAAAGSAIAAAQTETEKSIQAFVADNAEAAEAAQRKAGDLVQQAAKLRGELADMTLRAPIAGTVQAMTVTSLGQVVTTGQELLTIVPDDASLEVEAYVLNGDAGFVKEGQSAVVKIDAFPYTRYGTVPGRVTYVAKDAIGGINAAQQQLDASRPPTGAMSNTTAAQRTQDLVFPIRIQLTETGLLVDGKRIPLSSGMTVTVEVQTERRRVIDYILSPMTAISATAMHER